MPKTIEKPSAVKIKGTYGTMYYVKDMKKAVSFYQQNLGVKPSFDSPEWTEIPFNGHSLCLHLASAQMPKQFENGVLILHVDGIKKLVEDLKAKGTRVVADLHEVHPGAWAANFVDPEGNVVGLYEGPKS